MGETTTGQALTPSEWEASFAQREDMDGRTYEIVASDELADHEGISVFFVGDEWPTEGVRIVEPTGRHAVAALALHGQPFGFTWDDVEMAQRGAAATREQVVLSAALGHLAYRIAALLPPREGT